MTRLSTEPRYIIATRSGWSSPAISLRPADFFLEPTLKPARSAPASPGSGGFTPACLPTSRGFWHSLCSLRRAGMAHSGSDAGSLDVPLLRTRPSTCDATCVYMPRIGPKAKPLPPVPGSCPFARVRRRRHDVRTLLAGAFRPRFAGGSVSRKESGAALSPSPDARLRDRPGATPNRLPVLRRPHRLCRKPAAPRRAELCGVVEELFESCLLRAGADSARSTSAALDPSASRRAPRQMIEKRSDRVEEP